MVLFSRVYVCCAVIIGQSDRHWEIYSARATGRETSESRAALSGERMAESHSGRIPEPCLRGGYISPPRKDRGSFVGHVAHHGAFRFFFFWRSAKRPAERPVWGVYLPAVSLPPVAEGVRGWREVVRYVASSAFKVANLEELEIQIPPERLIRSGGARWSGRLAGGGRGIAPDDGRTAHLRYAVLLS